MLRHFCLGIAAVLGLAALANGIFMLYTPLDWYFAVPGVTTTGPFNQHFLRDIGLIFGKERDLREGGRRYEESAVFVRF